MKNPDLQGNDTSKLAKILWTEQHVPVYPGRFLQETGGFLFLWAVHTIKTHLSVPFTPVSNGIDSQLTQ